MNKANEISTPSDLIQQCHEIQQLADEGQYSTAILIIRSIKAADPKNIFIIALEKQIEKLLALVYDPTLSDSTQQQDIVDSIPNLVQRAVGQMKRQEPQARADGTNSRSERQAALANLKNSYFRLADTYLDNRQYVNALDEVKRVLILDPEDDRAREYSRRIEQLLSEVNTGTIVNEVIDTIPPKPVEKEPPPRPAPEAVFTFRAESRKAPAPEKVREMPELLPKTNPFKRNVIFISIIALGAVLATLYVIFGPGAQEPAATAPVNTIIALPATSQEPGVGKSSETAPAGLTPAATVRDSGAEAGKSVVQITPVIAKEKVAAKESASEQPPPAATRKAARGTGAKQNPLGKPGKESVPGPGNKSTTTNAVMTPPAKGANPPALKKLAVVEEVRPASPEPVPPPPAPFTERKPEVVKLTKPRFPDAARKVALEGEVVVKVLIDPQGKPVQAKIVKSTNEIFNNAVIEAVMNSQYSPGVMPSGPVSTWLAIPFTFKRSTDR